MTDLESLPETISVVIPCYQQGHFLGEAIESVLTQSYPATEIIVVDDGSTDDTETVAARYSGVRYIHQENAGSAAARNKGISESSGNYLVFLDADDRLLRNALETNLSSVKAHPECGFVFGRCQYIAHDGSPVNVFQPPYDEADDYLAMLRICPIWHPAAVMCRRSVVEVIRGFDTSFISCADYDFYLRVTKRWPVYCHNEVISEYRQHGANKSSDSALTLKAITHILRSQRSLFGNNEQYEEAYETGMRNFHEYYYGQAIRQLRSFLRTGNHRKRALQNIKVILRLGPKFLAHSARQRLWLIR